jgi:predicted phosphodiesterase
VRSRPILIIRVIILHKNTLRIQKLSDIHFEFEDFPFNHCDADVVVLACDIHVGEKGVRWILDRIRYTPVIYVLGNHEYFREIYPKLIRKLEQQTKGSNISMLENGSVQIEDVTFYGCTLWTDFKLFGNPRIDGYACQQNMTDYKRIRREPNYSKIRSIDVSIIKKQSITWLLEEYKNQRNVKNVVVTHHAPSIRSLPEKQRKEQIGAAYASHLDLLVEELSSNLWIHGHIHRNSDYYIGQRRVICNPKGYPDEKTRISMIT